MAGTFTLADYKLMREHGWVSYHPTYETEERGRVRCALDGARALRALHQDLGVFVAWELDDVDSSEFDSSGEPHRLWRCALCTWSLEEDEPHVLSALGTIDLGPDGHPDRDPYARVVEAELYLELEAEREACSIRGEN